MNKATGAPGFAPSDPTDGRPLWEWRSRYTDPEAKAAIRIEAIYLASLLILLPAGMLLLWLHCPQIWLAIPDDRYPTFAKYAMAWIAGTFGGTIFGIKWMYHVVARGMWNLDRRLWRLFTPHISGGLAFAVMALGSSGVVRIFDVQAINSLSFFMGGSFLVGYFSDTATAKLSELAETLFGTSRSRTSSGPPHDSSEPGRRS